MNRKLIRTTLAEVKERELQSQHARRAPEPPPAPAPSHQGGHQAGHQAGHQGGHQASHQASHQGGHQGHGSSSSGSSGGTKKKIPPEQTNAESFYYKKQMDAHTPMVIVLQDDEKLSGTIEWYDKNSIKLHRNGAPNLLILKHNIKYMYKDQAGDE